MKRGDLVLAAGKGDFAGKPRPALVVRNDMFQGFTTIVLCPITSQLTGALPIRVALPHNERTGLVKSSEVEIDKIQALHIDKVRQTIGYASEAEMLAVDDALRLWLDL